MSLYDQIKRKYPSGDSIYRTIGKDNINGIISCGFIRKPRHSQSDLDIVFKYYGALLLLEGEGKYTDLDSTELNLYPGCFIQRIPEHKHSTKVVSDGRWYEVFLCFGRDIYYSLEKLGIINSHKPVLIPGLEQTLIQKFINLYEQLKIANDSQLPFLLTKAIEIVCIAHEMDSGKTRNTVLPNIEKACNLLAKCNSENISMHDVATQSGMSYENFRKVFRNSTGISPHAYAIQRRIDLAKSSLQDLSRSIGDIAYELGYSDCFAFSKQFKKYVGQSPTDFRKQF